MKRIAFLALLVGLAVPVFAQNVSLDQAVKSSAQAIETRLPKGAKTAVLTFTSAKQAFSDYIIDELATALSASRNIQVIDRQHTDAIRKEFNIQFSGDVSDDEVKRIGHQLGAQYVVTGSLVDIGNAYRFRVVAINIETAVREGSSSLNININDPQVVFLLTGQRPNQATSTPSIVQNPFIGLWKATVNNIYVNGYEYIFDFKADGTIDIVKFDICYDDSTQRRSTEHKITVKGTGSYSFERNETSKRTNAVVKLNIAYKEFNYTGLSSQTATIFLNDNNNKRFTINLYVIHSRHNENGKSKQIFNERDEYDITFFKM